MRWLRWVTICRQSNVIVCKHSDLMCCLTPYGIDFNFKYWIWQILFDNLIFICLWPYDIGCYSTCQLEYWFPYDFMCYSTHIYLIQIRIVIWSRRGAFRLGLLYVKCLWLWFATYSMTIYAILTISEPPMEIPNNFGVLTFWTWLTFQTCIFIIDILTSLSGVDRIISKESFRFLIHIIRMLMLTLLCSYVFGRKNFFESYCKPL